MRTVSDKFDVLQNDDNDSRLLAYPEIYRVLKMNTVLVAFCSYKNYAIDYIELSKLFNIKNVLVWEKGGGGIGDLVNSLSTDYELAIVAHKGACPIRGRRDGSVWRSTKVDVNAMLHPTQKPLSLIKRIIMKWTDEGAIVLDPYAGSGTVAVACIETNRSFLGYEIDEKYHGLARTRIEAAQLLSKLQPSLFKE